MRRWSHVALASLLGGCAVGPRYVRPSAPIANGYSPRPLTATVAAPRVVNGASQRFDYDTDVMAQWWQVFRSRPLNALVKRALHDNPDVAAGQAALRAAREQLNAQRATYWPATTAGMTASRQKTSAALSATPSSGALYFSLYTPQVGVSYDPDVFGLNRRLVEIQAANAEQARFSLIATRITLATNVVVTSLEEASAREQIALTRRSVALLRQMLAIAARQETAGYGSHLDLDIQRAQLAQEEALLPPLLKQRDTERDLLAELLGAAPDRDYGKDVRLRDVRLPVVLPVTLPSRLVEHRPDIRMAETNVHAASAAIGVAVAERMPAFTLTADLGASALTLRQLVSTDAGFWDLGASVVAPIVDGGALRSRQRAAEALYRQSVAQYRSTVLTAFQQVADVLSATSQDARALRAAMHSWDAARGVRDQIRRQVQAGYTPQTSQLSAEVTLLAARISLVQSQAARLTDAAALFQALGGGWWERGHRNADRPSASDPRAP